MSYHPEQAARVVKAFADGTVERRRRQVGGHDPTWNPFTPKGHEPIFDFGEYEYRIKPKAREWWIVKLDGGVHEAYVSLEAANDEVSNKYSYEIIHVREVL